MAAAHNVPIVLKQTLQGQDETIHADFRAAYLIHREDFWGGSRRRIMTQSYN